MVELYGSNEVIKGARPNKYYQGYFERTNRLFFEGTIPPMKVLTAPLLKITQLTQKQLEEGRKWVDAGNYAITGYDEKDEPVMILDRGTCIYHPVLAKQSVLHEEIHWYLNLKHGHGKLFKAQIRRIAAMGAFDNLI